MERGDKHRNVWKKYINKLGGIVALVAISIVVFSLTTMPEKLIQLALLSA